MAQRLTLFPAPNWPDPNLQAKGRSMVTKAQAFDVGDYVVYPKHGVGRVVELLEIGRAHV